MLIDEFRAIDELRVDIQDAKIVAEKNIRSSGDWDRLTPEERRLLEKLLLDGKRRGQSLPKEAQEEIVTIKKQLSDLITEYDVSRRLIRVQAFKLM